MNTNNTHIRLQTKDLSIGYPHKNKPICVLDALNLTVDTPKFIAILGKNGIGKSTLVRTLAGIQPALNGEITLTHSEYSTIAKEDWAKYMAVVLTEIPVEVNFSVFEMVGLGRQVHTNWLDQWNQTDLNIINHALEITGILDLANRKFSELSDGQRQKVMIARALAQDTPYILLDEPTIHLDVNHSMELFLLFQKLAHDFKKTIIITTHEIGLATLLTDELWIMEPQKMTINSTQHILKNKILNQIFDTDIIRFNAEKHTFEYK